MQKPKKEKEIILSQQLELVQKKQSIHKPLLSLYLIDIYFFAVFLSSVFSLLNCSQHLVRCGHICSNKDRILDGICRLSGIQVSLWGQQTCWRLKWWFEWENDSLPFGPLSLHWLLHLLSHNCLNEAFFAKLHVDKCVRSLQTACVHTHTHTYKSNDRD